MKIFDEHGIEVADVVPEDSSSVETALMGDDTATLLFSVHAHHDVHAGCYCYIGGVRYVVADSGSVTVNHLRDYEYSLTLERPQQEAKRRVFINPVDGRIKFSLTATPREHLQMFVDNMNRLESSLVWSIGVCKTGKEKCIEYEQDNCWDALAKMAETFDTEFYFDGTRVSLSKASFGAITPLQLSYGKGNGLLSGVEVSNEDDGSVVDAVYVQGSDRNIDRSSYRGRTLMLPLPVLVGTPLVNLQTLPAEIGFDGSKFDNEQGYNPSNAVIYQVSGDNCVVRKGDQARRNEMCIDCSDIYPMREGTVSAVTHTDNDNDPDTEELYDIYDDSIPGSLNYADCQIGGETMTVIFQSGMLAGKEFDIATDSSGHLTGYDHQQRKFELVSREIDGEVMPNATFAPAVGDKYAVFGCRLPDEYFSYYPTKTGAEWDLFRAAVRKLHSRRNETFSVRCSIDKVWLKSQPASVIGKIKIGHYVTVSAGAISFGTMFRITRIKKGINDPYDIEIELSNTERKKSAWARREAFMHGNMEAVQAQQFEESRTVWIATINELDNAEEQQVL